jgi:hypothetical protein
VILHWAVRRQSGRCPNVGGALRAAIERQAGARCPHATLWLSGSYRTVGSVGTPSRSPSDKPGRASPAGDCPSVATTVGRLAMAGKLLMALIAGSFGRTLRSARRTPTSRQRPLVAPRGDFGTTSAVEPVALVGPVGRVPRVPPGAAAGARGDPPSPRPLVVWLWRASCERSRALLPRRTAGSRATVATIRAPRRSRSCRFVLLSIWIFYFREVVSDSRPRSLLR